MAEATFYAGFTTKEAADKFERDLDISDVTEYVRHINEFWYTTTFDTHFELERRNKI